MPTDVVAQKVTEDIKVVRFEVNNTSLIARMNQVEDNAGQVCAVLRFYVRGDGYTIEPNLGVVKHEEHDGEIRLWVPAGTKRLTVRHAGSKPLVGYSIPIRVESKTDYDIDVEVVENRIIKENKGHNVYMGLGYQIMSISGPSLSIGANLNGHVIEAEAVYGLNKTDDLYFYDTNGSMKAGFNYSAIRAQLRYGYEISLSDFFSMTPMIGAAYNAGIGKDIANIGRSSSYKNANSFSALGALRLTVSFNNSFKLCLTPEYGAAVYKDENCKLISKYNSTFNKWHTGFNLNVGLMIFF